MRPCGCNYVGESGCTVMATKHHRAFVVYPYLPFSLSSLSSCVERMKEGEGVSEKERSAGDTEGAREDEEEEETLCERERRPDGGERVA